jgi:limonene 1,2-monooxygenase
MLADRINQLDHMTRGRVMFGAGPGALVSDAVMMGIPVGKQRDRMDEALGVIVRLLRGEEVTHKSDWFELDRARLQMTPYSRPSVEVAVASQVSPTGARAAGRHGLGLLSLGATSTAGFNALASNWAIATEQAAEHGQVMDRSGWRLVGPMHVAETREQAMEDVRFGLDKWIYYFREIANLPIVPEGDDPVQAMVDTGLAVIGTPEDAAARIQQLVDESGGGFGAFLLMAHNWADWGATKHSYELMARYVFPRFQTLNENRAASMAWVKENKEAFTAEVRGAVGARIVQHMMEKGSENISPQIVELITGAAAAQKAE